MSIFLYAIFIEIVGDIENATEIVPILLKAKITRIESYCKLEGKEILGTIIPLKIEGNSEHVICGRKRYERKHTTHMHSRV